jgi:hypothetical protein
MQVNSLPLRSHDHDELHGAVDRAEPVWCPGRELGGLAWLDDVLDAVEEEPQSPVQDVQPVVALVDGQRVGRCAPLGADRNPVGMQSSGRPPLGERPERHAVDTPRPGPDPWVLSWARAQKLVGAHTKGVRQPGDVIKRQASLAGLQATQGGDIDACALGNIGQGQPSLATELPEALSDAKVDAFGIVCQLGKEP